MKEISHFVLPFSKKKLAEKSYLTFNLRISMIWAGAVPIKTNHRVPTAGALSHRQGSQG